MIGTDKRNRMKRILLLPLAVLLLAPPAALHAADAPAQGVRNITPAKEKTLVDYFLPMPPQGPLVSKGIWGAANVLPRDPLNGLEDSTLKQGCYWDGKIVKGDDGRYHMYASRWSQSLPHSQGWKEGSKAVHAVSDNLLGPYKDQGLCWPQWQDGKGHNVVGLRMHDGRYAVVTSEITDGEVFVSDSPDGPFKLLGKIEVDCNGFAPGLARYNKNGRMSNVTILLRPDRRYMIVARSTAVMISENGILGPYKILTDRVYKDIPGFPQEKVEDPTVWHSGGMYHIVANHWPSRTSYHLTSEDGIHNWKNRGVAFSDDAGIFRYTDGTVNKWTIVQRPTAYVEGGHVAAFNFSVIDVNKGEDCPDDNHGSKIVVVPFDGEAFGRDMKKIVAAEKAAETHNANE